MYDDVDDKTIDVDDTEVQDPSEVVVKEPPVPRVNFAYDPDCVEIRI